MDPWITKTIRKEVPANFVSIDTSNQSKIFRTEMLTFTKGQLIVDWISECNIPSININKTTKVELIECMNSTFQQQNSNTVDVNQVKPFQKKVIKRNVSINSDSDPWIIVFRLQTTQEAAPIVSQPEQISDSASNQMFNPENVQTNKVQNLPQISESTNFGPQNTISESNLHPQAQSNIDPSLSNLVSVESKQKSQVHFNPEIQYREIQNQQQIKNINEITDEISHFAEESKNQTQEQLEQSQSVTPSVMTMATMNEEEQKEEISRQVQRQIRLLSKTIADSKISQQLNISFGMLPGITDEQKTLINQGIENDLLSQNQVIERKPLDMVFLYSKPLVVKKFVNGSNVIEQCPNQELEIDREYQKLKKTIHKHCISFSIIKQNATKETFREIMINGARILHIICHGTYEESERNPSYLLFEDSDQVGLQDKIGVQNIKDILNSNSKTEKLELILVAACHSETIAKYIKEKVPNAIVIAISKSTAVLDQAATIFAKSFYDKLLGGESPRYSFNCAKQYLRESFRTLACCCQHKRIHAQNCRWIEKLRENMTNYKKYGYDDQKAQILATCDACKAHDPLAECKCSNSQDHQIDETKFEMNFRDIPACECGQEGKEKNKHNNECLFYRHFKQNYQHQVQRPNFTPEHVCCCQGDDFPHNEDQKFLIIYGQNKAEDEKKLDTPLYEQFNPGELKDHQEKSFRLSSIENGNPLLLLERNVEIFEVSKFLTERSDVKLASLLGSQDSGNYEIAVFAAQYCKERNTIHEAIYFDLSRLTLQDMLDRLNILLSLEAKPQIPKRYTKNIIDKMNEKFEKNPLPVTLIFDKLKKNDVEFQSILDTVIQMRKDLHRIKMIVIERSSSSELDFGEEYTPSLEIKDFDIANQNSQTKIIEILKNVAFQKNLYLEQYNGHLTDEIYNKVNNNNKIIKFVTYIKKEETTPKYKDNQKLLIADAVQTIDKTDIRNAQSFQSNLSSKNNQSLESQKPSKGKSKRCLACYQKLYQYEDEDDYQGDQDDQELSLGGESPSKTSDNDKIKFPPLYLNMSSDNEFIEQYRKQNPFKFENYKHEVKFMNMNTDKWECKTDFFEIIDGSYQGEIKNNTRIQHGRGIFIEKVKKNDKDGNPIIIVQSVYEGWRIRNKREIYGRLIDKNGLIYEGEFKNNMPHGKGTVKQSDLIKGIYPRGFEFTGFFQNGMREEQGIMKIPTERMKYQLYFGQFNNNMMDGVFTIINDDKDQQLEAYVLDKIDSVFRKITAYVFTDKMYSFVSDSEVHDKQINMMPRLAFKSVSKLMNQFDKQFIMMDIEKKSNNMLLQFQFATLWLRYQAQNKQNSMILELLLGMHPQLEPLFDSLIDLRINLQIDKKNIKQTEESLFTYNMVSVKNIKNKIDETLSILNADNQLVDDIIANTRSKLNELLQQPEKTYNIWIRVVQLLINDEQKQQGIIDQLNQKDEEEQKNSSSIGVGVTPSNDLCSSSSIDRVDPIHPKKQQLPDITKAREMVKSLIEAENMSQPIKEYINLERLVEDQDVAKGKIYQVKTKQDIIYSLLNEQKHPNLLKYRVNLGRAFLEMCVSMYFVNNPAKNCIEEFMNNSVLDLFKQSGYYEIAISQQKLNEQKPIEFQIQADDDQIIKDLLDFKNLRNIIKEDDQQLIDTISSQIGCENKQHIIIDKALEILNRRIQFKKYDEIEQEATMHHPVSVEIFYNFLGAIAQLINPEKAVKFLLALLQKSKQIKTSTECKKKMQRLYKFRKMVELEKYIGTEFNDRIILVQSLTHESYSQSSMKQQSLEISGRLTLKFMILREFLLKCDDSNILEKVYNSDIFEPILQAKISVLATLLGLHSKLIYEKGHFNSNHDYFEDIVSIFQMQNQADNMASDYNQMIEVSLNILKKFKLTSDSASKGQKLYAGLMGTTLYAFIGALNLDSSLSNTTYQSLLTLLPFIFPDSEYSPLLKQECLKVLEEKKTTDKASIIRFPELFRVSKEGFKVKTFSMNDCFDYPGKLFNIHEFDIHDEKSYEKLVAYIKDLDNRRKHKLINIIFSEENFTNPTQYIETSYYIVHTHVVSVCLRKEKEMGRPGLVKDFLTRMRNQAKQRVINEEQMLMKSKDHTNGLTLAQKIKILINLNSVQYQKTADEAEKLYDPPTEEDAMNYVNKLNIKKEKTFDSIIYTYEFKESVQGVQIVNPLKPEGQTDLHFIKQPLLQQHEGDGGTHEIIQKNKKYIYNNILENQLIQLSHFLSNQESAKQNELIILDEEQLRVVDYMALRQESFKIDKLQCPIELISICFQIIALATQSLHEFDVYHGNIKPDRIKLNRSGYDGFLYNGNFVILQPDHVLLKNITDPSIDEDAKIKLVNQMELYIVDKLSIGFCTQFMTESLNKKQLAKCELYREEAYQMMNTMQLLIRTQKKIPNPTSEQSKAKEVLEKIRKVIAEYVTAIGKNLEMKTIFDVQEKLAEDLSIAEESISLFRACLKPTFSRNLWIYLDQMTPLHPKLQQLVFPWKQFKNKPIDLINLMKKSIEQDDDQLSIQTSQSLSPRSEVTMSKLRKLHLGFIEDWWYEIASLMDESSESYERIDSNELEYVKSMIQSGSIRVKLEWLRVKILIIQFFKAVSKIDYQLQQTLSKQNSTEESKDQEESKQGAVKDPEVIRQNIYNKVRSISEAEMKKDRNQTKSLSRSSSASSFLTYDDEVQEQEQLRHFVKAAIYPLKDVHIKIYKMYGPQCLKEYIKIIIEALEWIQNDSFYEKMIEAFVAVSEQSQLIKDVLKENPLPQTQVQIE